MKVRNLILLFWAFTLFGMGSWQAVAARANEPGIAKDARCPVCGMFVAKFPQWVTQLVLSDGRIETFDGVKDMMAYFFSPQSYGAAEGVTVGEVRVKDYYGQQWIDGRRASYVIGSDVYGPMGHELIPFAEKSHAETFLKDHKGQEILPFPDITPQLIESLRHGHGMMRHGKNN